MLRAWTFGHGTTDPDELIAQLHAAGVDTVVDVRSAPGSRRNPHMARAELHRWLPQGGVGYRWDGRLGGFRALPANSPDTAWRNDSFRGYAAHMRTAEFHEGIDELLADLPRAAVAVMCSESVWWRCHRRLIADHLALVHRVTVIHLMPGGRETEHPPLTGARVADGDLVYDKGSRGDT